MTFFVKNITIKNPSLWLKDGFYVYRTITSPETLGFGSVGSGVTIGLSAGSLTGSTFTGVVIFVGVFTGATCVLIVGGSRVGLMTMVGGITVSIVFWSSSFYSWIWRSISRRFSGVICFFRSSMSSSVSVFLLSMISSSSTASIIILSESLVVSSIRSFFSRFVSG